METNINHVIEALLSRLNPPPNDEIADACEAAGYPRTWFREGDKLPTYIELSEQESHEQAR